MTPGTPFSVRCTLTFGDIYGQILAWMAVIFVSLAAGLALMGSSRPLFALVGVGLILVLSVLNRLRYPDHLASQHRC